MPSKPRPGIYAEMDKNLKMGGHLLGSKPTLGKEIKNVKIVIDTTKNLIR